MDKIELKIKNYIIENKLLSQGDKVLLSLSAGKDSITMFNIILKLSDFFKIDIITFHLNHMTRGKNSDSDEEFLKKIMKEKKIKLFSERFDFIKKRDPKISFEEQARNVRYNFLTKILQKEKCTKIATAHNYQDNAETLLMRIFTGTGIYGLKGIEAKRDYVIRPLLTLSVSEIYDYLDRNNLKWREDESNRSNEYSRNYIRNFIMPEIKKKFPMLENSLINLSKVSSETISLIEELMVDKLEDLYHYEKSSLLILSEKISKSKNMFNYIIIKLLREEFNFYCSNMIVNEIYRNFQQEKSNNNLYQNNEVVVEKIYKNKNIWIKIYRPELKKKIEDWQYEFDLKKSCENIILKEVGIEISLSFVDYEYFTKNKENNKCIFVTLNDKIDTITIRNRRKGDMISLNYGTKKIKNLLIEKKLDNISKSIIPLLIVNSDIAAFMPGLVFNINNKISKDYIVNKDSKKVLAIQGKT